MLNRSDRPSKGLNYTRHLHSLRCFSLRGLVLERREDDPGMLDRERHLALRAINLFAGPNGSGKTTILDAVRSLFDPTLLARLRRENIPAGVVSGLHATFDSDSEVIAFFHQTGEPQDSRTRSEWSWQLTEIGVLVVDVCDVVRYDSASATLPLVGPLDAALPGTPAPTPVEARSRRPGVARRGLAAFARGPCDHPAPIPEVLPPQRATPHRARPDLRIEAGRRLAERRRPAPVPRR